MKVTIHFDDFLAIEGTSDSKTQEEACDLIDMLVLDLERIPNQGEPITFFVGRFWIDAKVKTVETCYCEIGNPYIKERVHGLTYNIFLDDVEIMETYKD